MILADVLPLSSETSCQMGLIKIPLHTICLKTELMTWSVRVGVCDQLYVQGVSMILGNYLVGGKVTPLCEISQNPDVTYGPVDQQLAEVFPACVVRKFNDLVDLHDTFGRLTRHILDSPTLQSERLGKDSTEIRLPLTHKQ